MSKRERLTDVWPEDVRALGRGCEAAQVKGRPGESGKRGGARGRAVVQREVNDSWLGQG